MKAAVIKIPGTILVENFPTPKPGNGEVLLKIDACAICGTDQRVLKGEKHVDVPIVGHEITGTVAELGANTKNIILGERYAVQTVIGCGECEQCKIHHENLCEKGFKAIGYQWNGGFAEYMIMPKGGVDQGCLIPIPDSMSANLGTLIEPLSCCINGIRIIPFENMNHVVVFGGGIIGVLNGMVAKFRGAKTVTIIDVSQERLDLLIRLGLPLDNFINSSKVKLEEWVKNQTNGKGAEAVVVAASVKSLVPVGLKLLARDSHLSIFSGMPKSDSVELIDLNLIHYSELHIHGANSSAYRDYIEAREMIMDRKAEFEKLVTHEFKLSDFNIAVDIQGNPVNQSLKVIIVP